MSKYIYAAFNLETNEINTLPEHLQEGVNLALKKKKFKIKITNNIWAKNAAPSVDTAILDFSSLRNIPQLESIFINDDFKIKSIIDIDSIYNIKNLTEIVILQPITIDVSKIKSLTSIKYKFNNKIKNVNLIQNLNNLWIWSYKKIDLHEFDTINKIKELHLVTPSIQTLDGILNFPHLQKLTISYAKNLINIDALNKLKNLEELTISNCPNIIDFDYKIPSLKKIELGKIKNIYFIKDLPNLEEITFKEVIDGDISSLLKHEKISDVTFYPNKKHYSHKSEEINEINEIIMNKNTAL